MTKKKRVPGIVVIDTNVIMNNAECIFQFKDNHVVIPFIVLKELDKHKTGKQPKNYQVRLFLKLLDGMSSVHRKDNSDGDVVDVLDVQETQKKTQRLYNGGVDIIQNDQKTEGKISVKKFDLHEDLVKDLDASNNDHQIINVAYQLEKSSEKGKEVRLISEDLNLRLVARTLGLNAEASYFNNASEETLKYTGLVEITDDADLANFFTNSKDNTISEDLAKKYNLLVNQYIHSRDELYRYEGDYKIIKCNHKKAVFGIEPRNTGQRAMLHALLDESIDVMTVDGPAGTGKTLIALAAGFHGVTEKDFESILVSRREIGADEEAQGFLPGDADAKSAPYMMPFVDNLNVISRIKQNSGKIKKITNKMEDKKQPFTVLSLAYLRGRTFSDSLIIIDEMQNIPPAMAKLIVTRAGEGTKIVFCGDLAQIDDKYLRRNLNGLSYLMENLKGEKIYSHVSLTEVERSRLAKLGTKLPS
ncbi:MAG: PhoH family protein [Minisyncoccia bacterium]